MKKGKDRVKKGRKYRKDKGEERGKGATPVEKY